MIDDNVDGGRLEAAAKGGVGSKEEMGLRENRGPVGYARRHRPERKVGRGDLKRQEARETLYGGRDESEKLRELCERKRYGKRGTFIPCPTEKGMVKRLSG